MKTPQESVVVLGNIDGFHRGHQELINQALKLAQPKNLPVWVATFHPHPIEVLKPSSGFQRLFSLKHQQELLKHAGVEGVYYFPFNQEMAQVSAQDFLNDHLKPALNPKAVIVGFNFRFGKGRGGGADELRAWGEANKVEITIVPAQTWKNEVVSSTQVRKHLLTGQVAAARELLGFPFFIEGKVEPGAGRGRGIGFPTANMNCPTTQIPAFGVYLTSVEFQGRKLPAVSHLGPLPSFGDAQARLETHVLDGNWDFTGQTLKVEFLDRVREVRKFDSVEQLAAQIKKDIQTAREHHERKT